MGKKNKYGGIDNLRKIIATSRSMSEVARKCGYKNAGGTTAHLRKLAKIHGIDTSHFAGQGWASGRTSFTDASIAKANQHKKLPWNELFMVGSRAGNHVLLRRLIESGKREYKCCKCGIQNWNGLPIRLQLDHVNGDSTDHREENLEIVCPNCHSQTPTFCRGDRGRGKTANTNCCWWQYLSMPR